MVAACGAMAVVENYATAGVGAAGILLEVQRGAANMPGSVKTNSDSGSLPDYPFKEFAAYAMPYARESCVSDCKGGCSGQVLKSNVCKRRWRVAQRLTVAELQTMRDFYKTHLVSPFKFDDGINDIECRAVFTGTFQESRRRGYFSVSVELLEVV
jgi:hypothetical protein